jgi:hypothetical protein
MYILFARNGGWSVAWERLSGVTEQASKILHPFAAGHHRMLYLWARLAHEIS